MTASSRPVLEIAAFELASAFAAAEAGADRIELCRDASAGGLTPPLDWIRTLTAQTDVPVVAMIRSHADGWTFTDAEYAAMRDDALAAIRVGASGIVWGTLRADGTVDEPALRQLVETVAPHPVVFHRAFDAARDLDAALETLIDCGVTRVLTGGGPGRALDNVDRLADLVQRAGDRITVMPGGGVRASNVAEIIQRTGACEVHSAASSSSDGRVDPTEARTLRAVLRRAGEVQIRPLTGADAPILSEMLYHAIHVPPGDTPPPPDVVDQPSLARYVAGWMQRAGDVGCLAEANGEPVGAAWLRLWPDAERGYGFVDAQTPELSMAVQPGVRGQGIGTRLLRQVLRESGAAAVSLSVSCTNPARRLYEREGFVTVGELADDSLTMVWRA
ncbi:MAG: copper homeostasis protein CutC [Bacteroidota bacterium]